MLVVLVCGFLLAITVLWALRGSGGQPEEPDDVTFDLPSAVPDPVEEAPVDLDLVVGETYVQPGATTVVLRAQVLGSPALSGASSSWFGVRVRQCVDDNAVADGGFTSWSQWSVVDGRGESYPAADLVPPADLVDQVLRVGSVAPGDCAVGWLMLDLPTDVAERIALVRYAPEEGGTGAAAWSTA